MKPIYKKLIIKTLTLCVFFVAFYCKAEDVKLVEAIRELNVFIAENGLEVQKSQVSDWSAVENSGTKFLGLNRTDGQQLRITLSGYSRADGWRADTFELLQTIDLKFVFPDPANAERLSSADIAYAGGMTAAARRELQQLIKRYLILKFQTPHDARANWPLIFDDSESSIRIKVDMVRGNLAVLRELFLELGKIVRLFSENERSDLVHNRIAAVVKGLEVNCRAQVSFDSAPGPFSAF